MTMTQSQATLSGAIDIGFMDLQDAVFFRTAGGFTGLKYKDKEYKRVSLRRALPLKDPDSYISVADQENKEIAILRSVQDLAGEQLQIVLEELDRRYYCPRVASILSVKDKLGYVYMELFIVGPAGNTPRNCAVKDVNKNIRMLGEDSLIIFDVDGNRYLIPSLKELDKKSLRQLEPYLF